MPTATPERHRAISAMFMEHAEDQFRQGDLLQASEKAWGGVAHYINGIALENGWPAGNHKALGDCAKRLIARDPAQADLRLGQWASVQLLHANFYQELSSEDDVRRGIDNANALISAFRDLADRPDPSEYP